MASTTTFNLNATWTELGIGPGVIAVQVQSHGETEFYVSDSAPAPGDNGFITSSDLDNHPRSMTFGGITPTTRVFGRSADGGTKRVVVVSY